MPLTVMVCPKATRSPLTVPITTVASGSIPDADRSGSIWAMPTFIARAQASTSGTKIAFSRNLIPTSAIPAIRPSSITSSAKVPTPSASRVRRSASCCSPSTTAAAIACMSTLAPA